MTDPSSDKLDRLDRQLELAIEKKDWDRVWRLEQRRADLQAKQFKAHMRRVKAMTGGK